MGRAAGYPIFVAGTRGQATTRLAAGACAILPNKAGKWALPATPGGQEGYR